MRASPMYSDGELIFFLVQYKESNYTSSTIKTVLETYEVDENRKMKRIQELPLYKDDSNNYFKGSRKTHDGGYLSRGSIACNGSVLLWHSSHYMHVFDCATGIRKKKEHYNSTALISTYCTKTNYYFHMDGIYYVRPL